MIKKQNLKIIGSFFSSDGYSSHTRQLFKSLSERKDTNMKIETQLPKNWVHQVTDKEFDAITKEDDGKFDNIIIALPHMWRLFLGNNKNYVYVVWEGDSIPKSYIKEIMNPKVDLILVPSQHTVDAICQTFRAKGTTEEYMSGYHNKIKIIPHGYDPMIFKPQKKEQNTPFTFFADKGWARGWKDRGGLSYLIKSYLEEFTSNDNVELFIKINMSYGTNIDIFMKEIQIENKDLPKIKFITENLPFNKLPEIYKQADVYCMSSLSESFGLGALQAMAMGIPCITNDFGGQTDFINEKNGILLKEGKLKEISDEIIYEGIKWKEPDINELRKQMRWAFENQDKIKEKGKQAEEDSKAWTWDISANKLYNDILEYDGTNK